MYSLTSRNYGGPLDLERILQLRRMIRDIEPSESHLSDADLRNIFADPAADATSHTHVWEDQMGQVAAFALVHLPWSNLEFDLHPELRATALEAELVAWAMMHLRAVGQKQGPLALDACSHVTDTERRAFLERNGFVETSRTLRMECSLVNHLPPREMPSGFILRPLDAPRELEAYVSAHQDAFGTTHMTMERRRAFMQDPEFGYHADLDWVAVTPGGTLAGFCVASVKTEQSDRDVREVGWIEIIGTRPAFRNKGLGRAMLVAGLWALRHRGPEVAVLTTGSWNTAAQRVYRAAGFQVVDVGTIAWYTKQVDEL